MSRLQRIPPASRVRRRTPKDVPSRRIAGDASRRSRLEPPIEYDYADRIFDWRLARAIRASADLFARRGALIGALSITIGPSFVTLIALLQISHGNLRVFAVLVTSSSLAALWVLFAAYIVAWFIALLPMSLSWFCAAYVLGQVRVNEKVPWRTASKAVLAIIALAGLSLISQPLVFGTMAFEGPKKVFAGVVLTAYPIFYILMGILYTTARTVFQGKQSGRYYSLLSTALTGIESLIRWPVRISGILLIGLALTFPVTTLDEAVPKETILVGNDPFGISSIRGMVANVDDTRLLLVDANGAIHSIPNNLVARRFPS